MVIECAFGRLKSRFGILRRPLDTKQDDLPFLIYACFVLHNFCEKHGESVSEDRVERVIQYDRLFQPAQVPAREINNSEGKRVRRILAQFLDP